MVAAENGALPGGKVGGVGDVVREVPAALAERGCRVSIITPAFGRLGELSGVERIAATETAFGASTSRLSLYRARGRTAHPAVEHLVLGHPDFAPCGAGRIYCHDPQDRPFATDASKFALFCAGVADLLVTGAIDPVQVIRLHDWHVALLPVLRDFAPAYAELQKIRCVFTVHKLALQGVRPFAGDPSAFETWFPDLRCERAALADPRWPQCVNPMASASGWPMRCTWSHRPTRLRSGGRVVPRRLAEKDWSSTSNTPRRQSAHSVALEHLHTLGDKRPETVLTSVSRLTDQKFALLREPGEDGGSGLA